MVETLKSYNYQDQISRKKEKRDTLILIGCLLCCRHQARYSTPSNQGRWLLLFPFYRNIHSSMGKKQTAQSHTQLVNTEVGSEFHQFFPYIFKLTWSVIDLFLLILDHQTRYPYFVPKLTFTLSSMSCLQGPLVWLLLQQTSFCFHPHLLTSAHTHAQLPHPKNLFLNPSSASKYCSIFLSIHHPTS